jgi:uncharacterized protein (TIGR02391 family)
MDELERQNILKEIDKLKKDLSSYKKRQEKHVSVKFTEGQTKKLEYLRDRIRFNYRWLKEHIDKYGGTNSIKIAGIQYDVFNYVLRKQSLNILSPELFNALSKALKIIDNAISEMKSIPITTLDWHDIKVRKNKEVKETTPISIPIQLHPKVLEVSKSLFETGHYSQAIFEAFKAVNNFVKEKTGSSLDGKDLMTKVFREEAPIIKLNELKTQSDKDEQEGFMFLYMGAMVGIRNPKAHENIIQTDPYKTLEYLALASLLMRRVEEGTL